jgi:hypothetical protein
MPAFCLGENGSALRPFPARFYASERLKTRIPKAVQMELFRLKWTTSKTTDFPVEMNHPLNSRFSG